MPQTPDGTMVRVSAPLTNLSVAYTQQGQYLATRMFGTVPVARQGDLYWKMNRSDWRRTEAEKRAPATESAGGGWRMTTDSYYCHVYAVHKDVDDQTRANAVNDFNLDADATRWVTNNLLLKRDVDFIASYFKTGVWTGSTSGSDVTPGTLWSAGGSDPVGDIRAQRWAMKEKTGYFPNRLLLGAQVYTELLDNASILDRIRYTERGIVGLDLLASLFEVDQIMVADVNVATNTLTSGTTDPDLSFMADKQDALLCYADPNPGLQTVSAGYIFAWTGLLGAGATGTAISRFRMEAIKSDRVEGEMAYDMKVVAPDLGIFFNEAVS